jgi:hypothetical protein
MACYKVETPTQLLQYFILGGASCSETDLAVILCSNWRGQATSGTPPARLSSAEFQPQWFRNAPQAGCVKTRSWGTIKVTILPLPLVRSSNPITRIHNFSALVSGYGPSNNPWECSWTCPDLEGAIWRELVVAAHSVS